MMKNTQINYSLRLFITMLLMSLITEMALAIEKPQISEKFSDIVVIVHKSNPLKSISKKELSNIFLGKEILWKSGRRIVAGMLSTDKQAIKVFLKSICNKSVKRFNAHWMRFIFSGSGTRPQELSSNSNANYFVKGNKNSIAIIDSSQVSNYVKRLKITD